MVAYATSSAFFHLHVVLLLCLLLSFYHTYPAYPVKSVFKMSSLQGPEFCDSPSSFVLLHVREYASYLDSLQLSDMHASHRVLTVRDW